MLRTLLLMVSLALAGTCTGQSLEGFKSRLQAADSLSSARVKVTEYGTAAKAVARLRTLPPDKIKGFRVRIFFDNSQTARSKAEEAHKRFTELFPDVPAYMSYKNPYWEVSVGNCTSNEEAVMLKGRVEGSFNGAIISREEIPIAKMAE